MTMHEAISHSREDVGMLFHVATIKEASPRPKGGGRFFVLLLIILSLSFFVGAGIFSFSFLLIGDYHNKEILWLRDSDNNNMRGQVKGDSTSMTESSSANETSTSLSNEQIIVKMEDLLKRMAEKNTQLNEKLHKREEEIDSLKNYLS